MRLLAAQHLHSAGRRHSPRSEITISPLESLRPKLERWGRLWGNRNIQGEDLARIAQPTGYVQGRTLMLKNSRRTVFRVQDVKHSGQANGESFRVLYGASWSIFCVSSE